MQVFVLCRLEGEMEGARRQYEKFPVERLQRNMPPMPLATSQHHSISGIKKTIIIFIIAFTHGRI